MILLALSIGIIIGGLLSFKLVQIEMGWQKLSSDEVYSISNAESVSDVRKSKFCMASEFSFLVMLATCRDDWLERVLMSFSMPVLGIVRIVQVQILKFKFPGRGSVR